MPATRPEEETAVADKVAAGLEFPEGPVALTDGSVLVTEIAAGTLARVSPNGNIERIAHLGGGPNGAAIGPDGAAYLCFGGPDGRTAFITCSGTGNLIAVDWPRPGGRNAGRFSRGFAQLGRASTR